MQHVEKNPLALICSLAGGAFFEGSNASVSGNTVFEGNSAGTDGGKENSSKTYRILVPGKPCASSCIATKKEPSGVALLIVATAIIIYLSLTAKPIDVRRIPFLALSYFPEETRVSWPQANQRQYIYIRSIPEHLKGGYWIDTTVEETKEFKNNRNGKTGIVANRRENKCAEDTAGKSSRERPAA